VKFNLPICEWANEEERQKAKGKSKKAKVRWLSVVEAKG